MPSAVKSLPSTSVDDEPRPVRRVVRDDRVARARRVARPELDAVVSAGRIARAPGAAGVVDVAQPIPAAPPSRKRATWNVATAVAFQAATLGSTSVWCWPGALAERVDGDPPRDELAVRGDPVGGIGGHDVDALAAGDACPLPPKTTSIRSAFAVPRSRSARRRALDHGGRGDRRSDEREHEREGAAERTRTEFTVPQAIRSSHLAERGGRRFSQAISEGDGISVIVEVDGPEAARDGRGRRRRRRRRPQRACRAPRRDGAADPLARRRDSWRTPSAQAPMPCFVVAEEHDEDGDGVAALAAHAAELGLDLVVSVSSEEVLERVLELHDPETFHLATGDLERALELLTDVPVGKLAIAEASNVTREQVVELERRGMDAVIVPARNVAELVGGAPPSRLTGEGRARHSRAILAGAAALRLVGIQYGLPYGSLLDPDEQNVVPRAWRMTHGGGLDPHFFDWPTLVTYAARAVPGVAGEPSYLTGRLVIVAFAVARRRAAWWLGSARVRNRCRGVAAAVTAVATTHVAFSTPR